MFPRPVASRDEGKVYRLVSSSSGQLLALLMDTLDGEVRVLEGTSLRRRGAVILGAMRTARGCAFTPDDSVITTATRDDVVAFDLRSGAVTWTAALAGDEPALTYSPDGKRIVVGGAPDTLVMFNAADGSAVSTTTLAEEPRALIWDRFGLVAITQHTLVLLDNNALVRSTLELCRGDDEARELTAVAGDRLAIGGAATGRVWIEIRARGTGVVERAIVLEGDHRAEGLAFAGGVIFLATEGGTYRVDPPYDQLVRWLPPLGGAHDPTRVAALAGGHVAIAARDVRVFRTRS